MGGRGSSGGKRNAGSGVKNNESIVRLVREGVKEVQNNTRKSK